jgi:putative membrane protein
MRDGFLGFQSSFMLDAVVCALVLVVPLLVYSIYVVKVRRNYLLHKRLQLFLGAALLVAVAAFEVDLQLVHGGWKNIVAKRTVPLTPEEFDTVQKALWVHLVFAVTTPFLWAATIGYALKRFPHPPCPGDHSPLHKKLAWASTIDLVLTTITGLIFYYLAIAS